MNKNTLLLLATVAVSLALIYTLFSDNDIDTEDYESYLKSEKTMRTTIKNSNTAIEYKTTEIPDKATNLDTDATKGEKPKREKYLETWVLDESKKFEIALVNPNIDLSKNDGRYRNIRGKVDGKEFNLPVPLHLIQENPGDIKLRIRNLDTNESTLTPAIFIDDMTLPAMHHKLIIDSSDPDNYQKISEKQVPPPRPGM